ncbi:hypothetical protein CVV65_01695 [Kyrpidia spormannii]|uniref:UDP-glucose 4-epimerase n=1 Tax=Kyrpidia spormannii TaxID=2055160 RepID=A0A2K8N2T6_9BACL|nr:hypothetical protein [Kyrpidia spormannii]ATY83841.1 hypothetical protein CVV65_01695 [Kyrpidia spormannii]
MLDLADAHLEALAALDGGHPSAIFNVGTGRGHSVLEVIRMAEEVSGRTVPVELGAGVRGIRRCWWRTEAGCGKSTRNRGTACGRSWPRRGLGIGVRGGKSGFFARWAMHWAEDAG